MKITLADVQKSGLSLPDYLKMVQQSVMQEALEKTNGVTAKAAKLLGMRRTTMIYQLHDSVGAMLKTRVKN